MKSATETWMQMNAAMKDKVKRFEKRINELTYAIEESISELLSGDYDDGAHPAVIRAMNILGNVIGHAEIPNPNDEETNEL